MKLLIHIKFNDGNSVELESNSSDFVMNYVCIYDNVAGWQYKLADIKELIIKPLPTTES